MKHTNALIEEKSPYLLQHAHNPVNWYPWGDIAFKKANEEDKPIFLSIGYSTCHWCHVMERESFEDEEIAKLLNDHFVCIKVDREERPDIDSVYMEVCQMLTGSGGWPMTIVMTPNQKPFFAGTYFAKHNAYGRIGLYELLEYVISMWDRDRKKLLSAGDKLMDYLSLKAKEEEEYKDTKESVPDILDKAFEEYAMSYDEANGGFGDAPKFPSPHNLFFLMKYYDTKNVEKAENIVENTLIHMYKGGIYDHIGGGFSRYSTDAKWLVPHFEKMLYDNALLVYAYALFLEESKKPSLYTLFSDIITNTIKYVTTELQNPEGCFFCAQDADSDGKEGEYYLFTTQEIYELLDMDTASEFCAIYNITDTGHLDGKSIPNLLNNGDVEVAGAFMDKIRDKLIAFRKKRTKLFTDDKILTSWNALMIAALAKAGRVLKRETYVKYAKNAVKFLEKNLTDKDGRLYIRWRKGEKKNAGQLDDYAFYAWALLELYASTFELEYLSRAIEIADIMYELFADDESRGMFLYSNTDEKLITRPKEYHDGAMPSGNSVAAKVLFTIYKLTAEKKWQERIDKQYGVLINKSGKYPTGYGYALYAMTNLAYPDGELICVTSSEEIPSFLYSLTNLDILVKTSANKKLLEEIAPFTVNYPIAEKTTYYYCHKGMCERPVTEEAEVMQLIKGKS